VKMEESSNSIMAMAVPAMSPRKNKKTNDTDVDGVGGDINEVDDVKDVAQAWSLLCAYLMGQY
jgi:hypothetical protein